MNSSKNIVEYIRINKIPVNQMANDIGIPEERLMDEEVDFSASELLVICDYLNIRPEEMK